MTAPRTILGARFLSDSVLPPRATSSAFRHVQLLFLESRICRITRIIYFLVGQAKQVIVRTLLVSQAWGAIAREFLVNQAWRLKGNLYRARVTSLLSFDWCACVVQLCCSMTSAPASDVLLCFNICACAEYLAQLFHVRMCWAPFQSRHTRMCSEDIQVATISCKNIRGSIHKYPRIYTEISFQILADISVWGYLYTLTIKSKAHTMMALGPSTTATISISLEIQYSNL